MQFGTGAQGRTEQHSLGGEEARLSHLAPHEGRPHSLLPPKVEVKSLFTSDTLPPTSLLTPTSEEDECWLGVL